MFLIEWYVMRRPGIRLIEKASAQQNPNRGINTSVSVDGVFEGQSFAWMSGQKDLA